MWRQTCPGRCLACREAWRPLAERLGHPAPSARPCSGALVFVLGRVLQPAHEVAVLPLRLPGQALGSDGHTDAVLPAGLPLACVRPAVWPREHALAMLLAIQELALVPSAIHPLHDAVRAHVVPLPLAGVGAAVAPLVGAIAVHVVGVEVALVAASGVPSELSTAALVPVVELALEDRAVRQPLDAMALLDLHAPLSLVGGAVAVRVLPDTMLPIGVELALVLGAIREDQLAFAMLLLSAPLALVHGPAIDARVRCRRTLVASATLSGDAVTNNRRRASRLHVSIRVHGLVGRPIGAAAAGAAGAVRPHWPGSPTGDPSKPKPCSQRPLVIRVCGKA
mmetsp:Transcript_92616/g.235456  ORF Transcript_92616/g.235456 Transcript_92616/m.235456 type:complete len:337 (-) Transcript_92616:12-1022(-)